MFFNTISLHAQNDDIKDSILKISTLILGTDYSTNTNTFGKFSSINSQPTLSPYLSFYHKSGFFINGLLNFVGNSDSTGTKTTYQFNLKGGYQIELGEKFSITPSYTRNFYDENALTISTLYSNYAEVNIDYQLKYWNLSVSPGYLWGRLKEFSIDARTGVSYTFENVLKKDDALSIQLNFSGYFNNPNYLSKLFSFLHNYAEKNPDANKLKLMLDIFDRTLYTPEIREVRKAFRDDKALRLLARNYIPNDLSISIYDFLNYNNRFTLTSMACSLPITYMIGDFTFNFDFSIYRSMNQPVYSEQDSYYSYITAGLNYAINW
jgi:hypothetical protein